MEQRKLAWEHFYAQEFDFDEGGKKLIPEDIGERGGHDIIANIFLTDP